MTNRSSNRTAVPEAKGALDKFKYEVANELGKVTIWDVDLLQRSTSQIAFCPVPN